MLEKKPQSKIKTLAELQKNTTEILVANGRSFEPFVKTFSYRGENVAKADLGTLVGVFEVEERSEDSAYIVNFLASVAKKEYFNNHHRGAIESFEAALHKINLALSELVKHGNVSWLGKFHGSLAVLEKNNFHFSVTGQGRIFLLRGETFADISEGLASEESDVHPLKTFVEVSSGRLTPLDKIILSAPEIETLFSLDDLRKNALRMDDEGFARFLKTALVNELDMTGAIVIDISEETILVPTPEKSRPKKEKASSQEPVRTSNVFSEAAFTPPPQKETASETEYGERKEVPKTEYIDSKTGHIYIQGDTPEASGRSPFMERFLMKLQDIGPTLRSFFLSQSRLFRKGKKQGLIALDAISERAEITGRKTFRAIRKQWRKKVPRPVVPEIPPEAEVLEDASLPEPPTPSYSPRSIEPVLPPPLPPRESTPPLPPEKTYEMKEEKSETPLPAGAGDSMPDFLKEKLAAFYQRDKEEAPSSLSSETPPEKNWLQSFKASFLAILAEIKSSKKPSIPPSVRGEEMESGTFLRSDPEKKAREDRSEKFSFVTSWGRKMLAFFQDVGQKMLASLRIIKSGTVTFFQSLSPLQRKLVWGSLIALIVILILALWFITKAVPEPPTAEETKAEEEEKAQVVSGNEKNTFLAGAPVVLLERSDLVTSVLLDNQIYAVTKHDIIDVTEDKTYESPGAGSTLFAAPMDDLRLIFLYTDAGEMFAFSPISHTFTKNNLSLPEGTKIKSMGTYLTYLYILDQNSNQIYRFPRAEGGFGAATPWLRDLVTLTDASLLAVNETLFLSPDGKTVQAYFRGRSDKTLEAPASEPLITHLFTHPGLANVYALDTQNKRVLVWNQSGALLGQHFHDQLAEAKSLTANEKTNEVLLTTSNSLLSLKLDQNSR